ncbi:hypothetical protein BH10PAT2_BH10PAT2_2660 [soil metagenome]
MSERVRTRERFKMSTSVFCFFMQGDELLLILRNNTGWLDGHYSVPGGVKEPGETLSQAVIREAQEEVGLTVKPEDLFLAHIMHNFTTGAEWMGAFFIARDWSGTETLMEPHKHSEVRWAALSHLPENVSPYVLQAVEAAMQKMSYSEFGWGIPADADEDAYDYKHIKKKD